MKPARILLLVVAIVAGGLAAYLATRGNGPAPKMVQVAEAPATDTRVLVANQVIGVGQRLSSQVVEWQDWPDAAVRPEYITASNMPDAPKELTDTIARFEIFTGEPIREAKLVRSDQGYLSAVLPKGMRAVSLPVSASSSAGGFIIPNDHVDVVKTVKESGILHSETVLENVKVLAIGLKLGEKGATAGNPDDAENPSAQVFKNSTIATLELTPGQAEAVIAAGSNARLTLVLRSIADFAETSDPSMGRQSQTVRIIRYGLATAVLPAGGGSADTSTDADVPPPTPSDSTDYQPDSQNESAPPPSGPVE
jgi:pilus assembly protein CpaB